LNILYINNSLHLGGDTKCILKLCRELNRKHKIVVASSGGSLLPEFLDLGIKHYKIRDPIIKNIFSTIRDIFKIRKIVKNENIQIIHSHHRMTSVMSKVAVIFTSAKVVHTQHLCIEDKFFLTKILLKNTNIISVSNSAKDILIRRCSLKREKITTIYNTVEVYNKNKNVDKILINAKKDGFFTVGQVSRIEEYKGVYDFVDIAREVININNKIKFFLIGDGEESEKLKNYIKEKKLEDYVFMLGSKDNVIEHLKYIDLLLLCSYIEGLPLAPIEAFSKKIPVIATNIPGTCEEIVNGINGFLVPKKDINIFAKKINEIYSDNDLYKSLKIGAYRSFTKYFTAEKYISSHLKFYKKMLTGKL